MDYEQRYKDALDRAKKLKENSDSTAVIDGCEQIFPELQGNEDEQMRQWIIDDIRYNMNNETLFHSEYKKKAEKAIAWLEKQGKQNVDKVEPKFKVGDWVVFENRHQSIYQVEKIEDGYYILRHTHGGTFRICVLHDDSLRLWTIQDAKDGDVLANAKSVFIYAKVLYNKPYAHCGVDKFGVFKDNCLKYDWSNSVDNIHPATKEQRDLLFQKMKESN